MSLDRHTVSSLANATGRVSWVHWMRDPCGSRSGVMTAVEHGDRIVSERAWGYGAINDPPRTSLDDETLECVCWCGRTVVRLTRAEVHRGVTHCCDRKGCHAP